MAEENNGRITKLQLEHLDREFREYKTKTDNQIEKLEAKYKEACDEITELQIQVASMSERLAIYQLSQGAFTTIASVIAAIVAIIIGG